MKDNARESNTNADNVAADVEVPHKGAMFDGVGGGGGGGWARLVEDGLRNLSEVRERRRARERDEHGATRRSARWH